MDPRFFSSKFYEVSLIPHIRPNLEVFRDVEPKRSEGVRGTLAL